MVEDNHAPTDVELPDDLLELLESGRDEVATTQELAVLRDRLAPQMDAPMPDPSPVTGSGGTGLMLAGTGAVIAAVVYLAWPAPTHAPSTAEEPSVPMAPAPELAPPPSELPVEEAPAPVPAEEPEHVLDPPSEEATARREGPPPSEEDLLDRAQRALSSAPTRTLALTRQHRRLYPGGTLAQERDVLAIEAMTRLGQRQRARRLAESFERRWPGSPHVRRLRDLVSEDDVDTP